MQRVAHPWQPARQKMVALAQTQTLLLRRTTSRQQRAPMRLADLHAALRPAPALLFEGQKAVGRQALTHHCIDIDGTQILLHQAQSQLGILTQTPLRPLPVSAQRAGADQRHRAVLDDGIALIAVVHANAKEAVVFPVHHLSEHGGTPVAVGLWCLHDTHLRIFKISHQRAQPLRLDDVISIHHSHDLRARIGFRQSEVERTCFETRPARQVEKPEVCRQAGHEIAHRHPQGLIGRVVVDHDDLKRFVVQRLQAFQSGNHHVGRLVAAGQMDRDKRRGHAARQRQRGESAPQATVPKQLDKFKQMRQQDGHHHSRCGNQ